MFIHIHAQPGCAERIRTALEQVTHASRREAGCVRIHAYQCARDPDRFFIHSVWRDEAAFDRHAAEPHTKTFMAIVDPLVREPREVVRTRLID